MKIVLKFKTDNNFIPKDYHRFCIKFFKTAVSNYSDGNFFEKFLGMIISKVMKKIFVGGQIF